MPRDEKYTPTGRAVPIDSRENRDRVVEHIRHHQGVGRHDTDRVREIRERVEQSMQHNHNRKS